MSWVDIEMNWVDVEMSWVDVEMNWVEVDGAGWRRVHDLVISHKKIKEVL